MVGNGCINKPWGWGECLLINLLHTGVLIVFGLLKSIIGFNPGQVKDDQISLLYSLCSQNLFQFQICTDKCQ